MRLNFIFVAAALVIVVASALLVAETRAARSVGNATTTISAPIVAAPVYLTATTTLFDSLARQVVLPLLDAVTKNIRVPAINEKNGTLTVNVSAFAVGIAVGGIAFNFSAPSNVLMSLSGMELDAYATPTSSSSAGTAVPQTPISFLLQDGLVFCQGTLQPSNDGKGSVAVNLPLIKNETSSLLSVGNVTLSNLHLGDLRLRFVLAQEWNNILCQTAVGVVEKLFHDKTLSQVLSQVLYNSSAAIGGVLGDVVRGVLDKLPVPLLAPPSASSAGVSQQAMTLELDLGDLLNISAPPPTTSTSRKKKTKKLQRSVEKQEKQQQRANHPLRSQLLRNRAAAAAPAAPDFIRNRDLSLAVSDSSANALFLKLGSKLNLVGLTFGKNLTTSALDPYIPVAYYRCKNCPLVIDLLTFDASSGTSAFSVLFRSGNASLVTTGATLLVSANDTSTSPPSLVPLFSFSVDAAASLQHFEMVPDPLDKSKELFHASLALDRISMSTLSTNVGPLQPEVIAWVIDSVFRTLLLPIIDDLLYIPVPKNVGIHIGNFSITSLATEMKEGHVVLGMNVLF
jgi:hypothetical protein